MNKHILEIARREGVSPEQVYADMQAAIAAAWATSDPESIHAQNELTGSREVPTPGKIISLIAQKTLDKSRGGNYHHGIGSDR